MSQGKSKGKLIVVVIVFAILAVSSLACGSSDSVDAAPESTVHPNAERCVVSTAEDTGNAAADAAALKPTPDPVQVKYSAMQNAYDLGETLFFFDADQDVRYALFYGQERIIYIKERNLRGVKLTSNERLNLDVKKQCGDGDWCTEYSFQNVSPGDYVYFEAGLWRVTQYNPW